MRRLILSAAVAMMSYVGMNAQCTAFDGGPYVNLGAAPCAQSPVTSITAFEAWASESYILTGCTAGVTYVFDICGGTGGTAWPAEFTIIAPSGAIDAFGTDPGSNCQITWTASESGDYELGISEVGFCPGGPNTATNNGFPQISATGGPIPNCQTACDISALRNSSPVSICPGEMATVDVLAPPAVPTGGGQGVKFTPGVGGTGGLGASFVLTGVTFPYMFDNDLNGVLSFNGFPAFFGDWTAKAVVFTDAAVDPFGTICDSSDVKTVTFLSSADPGCTPIVCDAGIIDAPLTQVVCPGEDVALTVMGQSVPIPGNYLWYLGDTSAAGTDTLVLNFGTPNFTGDLNGLLVSAAIDSLDPGTYEVFGFVEDLTTGLLCDFTDETILLTILAADDPACGGAVCQAPNSLDVVEIGFGGPNARVNGTWVNPEGTTDCEVRGGRIAPGTIGTGSPQFANINNTQVITQTDGSTILFNIVLYNNPNVPFVIGQTYGYEVRCQCQDGSGFSDWSGISDESTFIVPPPPPGMDVVDYETLLESKTHVLTAKHSKVDVAYAQPVRVGLSDVKVVRQRNVEVQAIDVSVFPNPAENSLNIQMSADLEANVDVRLLDVMGRTVVVEQNNNSGLITFDISSLNSGLYIVELNVDGQIQRTQVVVK